MKKFFGLKFILACVSVIVIVISAVFGTEMYFKRKEAMEGPFFYEIPTFEFNVHGLKSDVYTVILTSSIELNLYGDLRIVKKNMPYIKNILLEYLKELSVEEFKESGKLILVREVMAEHINRVLHPLVIKNILFTEILYK